MTDIVFDEPRHEYSKDGILIPHVTGILADLCDLSHVSPAALEYARRRGSATHRAIELDHMRRLDRTTLSQPILARLIAYDRFIVDSGFKVTLCECLVHHTKLGYAGKLDLFGFFPGPRYAIIDIKTGVIEPMAGPQTAAYQRALMLEVPQAASAERYALWLGEYIYALKPLTSAKHWPTFHNRLIEWKQSQTTLLSQ